MTCGGGVDWELVLYGGGPTSLYEVPSRAFEQQYPGIKVTIHAGFSNVHNQTINGHNYLTQEEFSNRDFRVTGLGCLPFE